MKFGLVLAVVLTGYWLALSGYFTGMLLTLGVISILFVIGLCHRMKILDDETVPYLNFISAMRYFNWLFAEIVKANIAVTRAVLAPDMKVSPSIVRIKADQKTDMGRAMFANSITLTPGTVSMEMGEDDILVHALLPDMTDPAAFEEMGIRAARSVGET